MLCEDEERRPAYVAAIRMLALTGCRKSEIQRLEWRDFRGDRIQLRDGKTGSWTVWLGFEARAVIEGVPRHAGVTLIFCNGRFNPLVDLCSYWRKVVHRAGLSSVRLLDLRDSFASHTARGAETLPMIGKPLGHRKIGSTSRYAHLDDAHLLEAAQRIGDRVERLLSPGTATAWEDRR